MKKEPQEKPDLPLGWHSEKTRKGKRVEPALSAQQDTKAPVYQEESVSEQGMRCCLQDHPQGPAGSPGWRSDQGMWLLVFNFHLSRISLLKISGLKGRVRTSGSALRMRVWRSLTVARACALGRDGPGVPLGLWGGVVSLEPKGDALPSTGPPSPDQGSVTCRATDPETQV